MTCTTWLLRPMGSRLLADNSVFSVEVLEHGFESVSAQATARLKGFLFVTDVLQIVAPPTTGDDGAGTCSQNAHAGSRTHIQAAGCICFIDAFASSMHLFNPHCCAEDDIASELRELAALRVLNPSEVTTTKTHYWPAGTGARSSGCGYDTGEMLSDVYWKLLTDGLGLQARAQPTAVTQASLCLSSSKESESSC